MITTPVAALLLFDFILLLGVTLFFDRTHRQKEIFFLALLFFCSGIPALIYQIVWQRALFAIYGVNAQSVAVVVTAFMVGLGIGSLVGGRLRAISQARHTDLRSRRTWRRRVRSQFLAHFSLGCRLYGGLKPYFDHFLQLSFAIPSNGTDG